MATDILITKAGEEPGAASFKIEVPVQRVQQVEHSAAQAFAKRARLPGFRKGKAPLGVVRKRFHDAIREQVVREVVGESWKATLDQESLEPIADPRVHDLKFEAGSPLTFEFHVELKPDVTLGRVGGFTVTRQPRAVTDEMVDRHLEELRRRRAPWVPVEGRPAERGEMVSVTLATLSDDEPDEAKPYQIVLGESQAIPDVEQLIGALEPGSTTDGNVTFPDDFPDESKRGQTRRVRIALLEVKRQDLPDLDDAFAGEVGDFDGLAALRTAVREDFEMEARREADADIRKQLVEQLVAANTVPAPRPLVDRLLHAYREAYSIPDDTLEQFFTEFRPIAEAQVKRDLLLDQIVAQESLRGTEEELDARIAEIAERRNAEPGTVYAQLQKANRLKELEQTITEDKVFDFLLSQSTVTES